MKFSGGFKAITFVVISSLAIMFTFQNCSPVQFQDIEAAQRAQAFEIARIGADSAVLTAGVGEVPELKMFFVVDNSGTMKQNQLNLSQSFGTMFDSSSVSLNRFDSTTYLINTAQTLPVYQNDADKSSLYDAISSQQSAFSAGMSVSQTLFNTDFRTGDQNSGKIPGDNLGFQITKSSNPLRYDIQPATVMGSVVTSGDVTFVPSIKMKANSEVTAIENEFKSRLAVMSADRIPQVLNNNQYVPQFNSIVDTESGLCSIARVLRNPTSYISPGQLVSFAVVSDENDNNPAGDKCVQSVTELTGTEKLVDVDCKKNQTIINYVPPATTSTSPVQCKTSGQVGYTYTISYTKPAVDQTTVEYANSLKTAAKYTAKYYNLAYKKVGSKSYVYSSTQVVYYLNECFDVYSDGNKIGVKCTPKANPEPAQYKLGALTGTCYELAKTFNADALNVAGKMPVCTTVDRSVASCNEADPLCKATPNYVDATVQGPFAGNVPSQADCTTQAQTFSDYANTAVCTAANQVDIASCTGQPAAALCAESTAAVYNFVKKYPAGNVVGTDNCKSWILANNSDFIATAAGAIKTCTYTNTAASQANYNSNINFLKNNVALDGGNQIAKNQPCNTVQGVADAIFTAAIAANANIKSTDSCTITGYNAAADKTVNLALADCTAQAAQRCSDDKLRNCTATTIAAVTTTTPGVLTAFKTVPERISCSAKCSDSVMGVCDAATPGTTLISDFLISKFGAGTTCSTATSVLETGKVSLTQQLQNNEANICQADPNDKAPRFPYETSAVYYSKSKVVDFVTGTTTDPSGNQIPAKDLLTYIKARITELNSNQFIFTAFVQKSSDPDPAIGSKGAAYESLISSTGGQVESVLSKDYSDALKELSRVLKNSLERSLTVTKMRPDQIVKLVTLTKKATGETKAMKPGDGWSQNGNTIKVFDSVDFSEGDQFKVDFQNDVD